MALGILQKAKMVITKPSKFFASIKSEKGEKPAFVYLAVISLVSLAAGLTTTYIGLPLIPSLTGYSTELFAGMLLALPLFIYVAELALSFVSAGIVHLFAFILKGKGDYSATYKALAYSNTPSLLFGWIPIAGIIFGFYSLYLYIKGISILHKVSMLRAAAIVFLLPLVAVFVIAIVAAAIAYTFFATMIALPVPA